MISSEPQITKAEETKHNKWEKVETAGNRNLRCWNQQVKIVNITMLTNFKRKHQVRKYLHQVRNIHLKIKIITCLEK